MTDKRTLILIAGFAVVLGAFLAMNLLKSEDAPPSSVRVVAASEIEWGHLNPLRGDKSPRAGTLWGDRGAPVPCGFLVKFVDGFSSPPHIHPVTYRGIVVSGVVHNDDPKAEERWLPAGSFWTQPAGEVHITAAKGDSNVAYIEIEKGPYLVHPAKDAFQAPEEPIWMEPSTMEWAVVPGSTLGEEGAKVASLPGNPNNDRLQRSLIKLTAGTGIVVRSHGPEFHAVVIHGTPQYEVKEKSPRKSLEPGSYFGSKGVVEHRLTCTGNEPCVIYVRTEGKYDTTPAVPTTRTRRMQRQTLIPK